MTEYPCNPYRLVEFLSGLHDCHICKYPVEQITGKGKKRTFCSKYGQIIQRVRYQCIDRFPGFTDAEWKELTAQRKNGKCTIVLEKGVA
jgi:hypothetical protein